MSIGPTPLASQAAGASMSPTPTSSQELGRLAAQQARRADARTRAEAAAGIDAAPPEQAAADRDGDGRMGWSVPEHDPEAASQGEERCESRNPSSDECGNQLDLSG